jgi:hypothetical protein
MLRLWCSDGMNDVYAFLVPLLCWVNQERISPFRAPQTVHDPAAAELSRESRQQFAARLGFFSRGFASLRRSDQGALPVRWRDRDTFFDLDVQSVLKERHPSMSDFNKSAFKGYPIDAWRAVDHFARHAGYSSRSLAEFGAYMRLDPIWTSKLLEAMTQAQESIRVGKNPPTRVSARARQKENQRRERIMQDWAECWIAHYRLHPLRGRIPSSSEGDT